MRWSPFAAANSEDGMDNLLAHPGAIVTALGLLVTIIFWFARLEGKVSNIDEDRQKTRDERMTADAERDRRMEKMETVLNQHRENAEIHFNLRLQAEVDRRQGDRFKRVEDRLEHIEGKLDELLKK